MKANFQKRLRALEARNPERQAVLFFRDGSTRVLTIRKHSDVGILIEAMEFSYWRRYEPERCKPVRHEDVIRLIGQAERIATASDAMHTAWVIARRAVALESR